MKVDFIGNVRIYQSDRYKHKFRNGTFLPVVLMQTVNGINFEYGMNATFSWTRNKHTPEDSIMPVRFILQNIN